MSGKVYIKTFGCQMNEYDSAKMVDVLAESEGLLRTIMAQGPLAVAAVLEAVDAGQEMAQAEALLLEANQFGLLSGSADMREGVQAFLDKRKASFQGR